MIKKINNLGDAGVYCDFGDEINIKTNSKVISVFRALQSSKINGIINLAPSYNKLIVTFDLSQTNFSKIKTEIENLEIKNIKNDKSKIIDIPVCFDEEFSLDIERLKTKLDLTKDEILEKYLSKNYFCYMTGFVAGMPFLGDLEQKLQLKRLETPRVKVPKGSVGLTEQFCNIYTFESPGGWNIIGNTPLQIFNKNNELSPNLIKPGDTVKFIKISKQEYLEHNDK
tara:strand:- start:3787 stop:4464 length:678 start_codon:yes stop_codon:yes gene_type:complete